MSKSLVIAVFVSLFAIGLCADNEICSFNRTEIVNANTTTSCVLLNVTSMVDVRYKAMVNKTEMTKYKTLAVPCSANVTGTCNSSLTETSITLSWGSINDTDEYANILTFAFIKSDKTWNVSEITFSSDVAQFNESVNDTIRVEASIKKNIIGSPSTDRTYFCKSTNNLTLTTMDDMQQDFNFSVVLKDFKVQAFFGNNITSFSKVSRCSQDIKGSKIVPIAVGAALAGLVVIVLVAYIIGRLRSRRQSSYEALS